MNFQFKLRKGKRRCAIIAELRYGKNIRIRKSTEHSLPLQSVKYWDQKKERIKSPNDIFNFEDINVDLLEIRSKVYRAFKNLNQSNRLSNANLSQELGKIVSPNRQSLSNGTGKQDLKSVLAYFEYFIDFYKKNNSPHTGKPFSCGTARSYGHGASYLKKYIEDRNLRSFTFNDIDRDFYYDFIDYGYERGYAKNHVGSMIQKLKTVIQYAFDEGIHENLEFRKKYFRKFREDVNHPYLNEGEIQQLIDMEISDRHLDNVRDIFVIGCYTGLRVADLMSLLKNPRIELFNGRRHLHIVQQKTGRAVYIPLKQVIIDILNKRNGEFPPYVHMNVINADIKRLLKRCRVNEPYTIERTVGNKKVEITKPKYKLISCHSARRSFCTNAYNRGMPPHDIMVFSGHSSEKMVLLYIKSSAKERTKRAGEHPFFD